MLEEKGQAYDSGKIKITSTMIDAGESELAFYGGENGEGSSATVIAIFKAMLKASNCKLVKISHGINTS